MCQIKVVAASLLLFAPLFSTGHAAEPPMMVTTPVGAVATYGVSRADSATVGACHEAIAQWAEQYDPIDIETAMTGPVQGRSGEVRNARLFVEIVYAQGGGTETRAATIDCTVGADGQVAVAEAA